MLKINPIKLVGEWEAGYSLDYHTLSSEYLGDDEYGHPQFETARSEVGELLYRLKYRSERALVKVLSLTACDFVKSRKWPVEIVLPVPLHEVVAVFSRYHFLRRPLPRIWEYRCHSMQLSR